MAAKILWYLIVALLALQLSLQVKGFKQELTLYLEDSEEGNRLVFTKNEANLASYTSLLSSVRKVCYRGFWVAYSLINFDTQFESWGTAVSTGRVCKSYNASHFNSVKSLRHLAVDETLTNSISLYTKLDHQGAELLITERAYTNIPAPKQSLAVTGAEGWTIYEGQFLDGRNLCFKPTAGSSFAIVFNILDELRFTTIGSVFQGCNVREIREYKLRNNLM